MLSLYKNIAFIISQFPNKLFSEVITSKMLDSNKMECIIFKFWITTICINDIFEAGLVFTNSINMNHFDKKRFCQGMDKLQLFEKYGGGCEMVVFCKVSKLALLIIVIFYTGHLGDVIDWCVATGLQISNWNLFDLKIKLQTSSTASK